MAERIALRLPQFPNPTMEDIRNWAIEWGCSEKQTAIATVDALRARVPQDAWVCFPFLGSLLHQALDGSLSLC